LFVRNPPHSIAKTRKFGIQLTSKNGCKGKRKSRPTGLFEDATNQSTSSSSNLRLPKLSLRNFNGNFSEWSSFIQFFNNTVHSRADVAQIENFQYLHSPAEKAEHH
jgi:hypothetical protein